MSSSPTRNPFTSRLLHIAVLQETAARARTCVLVAVGGTLVGALAVADPIKPESGGVIAALHQMRIECHLVTGDNWGTANAIAAELGITQVWGA